MSKIRTYYGLVVRLIILLALCVVLFVVYMKYNATKLSLIDSDHRLKKIQDEIRELGQGIKNSENIDDNIKKIDKEKRIHCNLNRKYIITKISKLAREANIDNLEVSQVQNVTDSFSDLQSKISKKRRVLLSAYFIKLDFAVLLENDVHTVLQNLKNDIGEVFVSSLEVKQLQNVTRELLKDINDSQGVHILSGSTTFYWFGLCPDVNNKSNR